MRKLSFFIGFISLLVFNVSFLNSGSVHCFGNDCSSGSSYAMPDTGQSTSYTDTFGEDNDYQPEATQMSYTINADNTVTDNITGLMWRRCSQGMDDNATCTGTPASYAWESALSVCEDETTDYTDWRLPNIKELFTLVKLEGSSPFIDQTTFPATEGNYYLTGTTDLLDDTDAMVVRFNYGSVSSYRKSSSGYLRCVRAGP